MKESSYEAFLSNTLSMMKKRLNLSDDINKVSLKEYITDIYKPYFESKTRKLSSVKSDLIRLGIIENHGISEEYLEDITTCDIELFLRSLEKNGRSKATVNRYQSRLLAIFSHAINYNKLEKNVVKRIKRYKEFSRDVVLTSTEIDKLLSESKRSKNKDLYLILIITLNTGMRYSEILNLRRGNISSSDIILFDNETKSGYRRVIPMNNTLQKHIEFRLKKLHSKENNLFAIKSVRTALKNVIIRAELRYFRFHDLRRTFATHLKDRGVNIYDIKDLLGHCSITMTEKYLTTNNLNLAKAVNKISYA